MFREGLLLVIRRYYSVYTAVGMCMLLAGSEWNFSIPILPTARQHKPMTYTSCCIYSIVLPDDEQEACWKYVEVNY